MRLIVESNNKCETCDIIIQNASPKAAIYMATKLVTAVAKQFAKSEENVHALVNAMMLAVHAECDGAKIETKADEQVISPKYLS